MTEFGQFAMFLAVAAGALGIFFGPIGRAVGRLIEGPKRGPAADDPVVHDLRARVEQLEAERGRIAELEERIDFAERMLAQQREPGRIGG
ncbi:MAG: hypothetical protein ACREOC_04280 [Gemmatimonadales bacterium]